MQIKMKPKPKKCAVCLHIVKSSEVLEPPLCLTCFSKCSSLDVDIPENWLVLGAKIGRKEAETKLKKTNKALNQALAKIMCSAIEKYHETSRFLLISDYNKALEELSPISAINQARNKVGLKPLTAKETKAKLKPFFRV